MTQENEKNQVGAHKKRRISHIMRLHVSKKKKARSGARKGVGWKDKSFSCRIHQPSQLYVTAVCEEVEGGKAWMNANGSHMCSQKADVACLCELLQNRSKIEINFDGNIKLRNLMICSFHSLAGWFIERRFFRPTRWAFARVTAWKASTSVATGAYAASDDCLWFVYARRQCQCMFYWLFTAHKYRSLRIHKYLSHPLPCRLILPLAGCGAQSLSLDTSKMINFEGGGGRETTMRSARYQSLLSKPFDQSDCQLMINEWILHPDEGSLSPFRPLTFSARKFS